MAAPILKSPAYVLGGDWRRWAAWCRVVAAGWWVVLIVVAGAVAGFAAGSPVLPPAVWLIGGVVAVLPVSRPFTGPAYWRLRWPWDARAGGMVASADRDLNPARNRIVPQRSDAVEVAPTLLRCKVSRSARTYLVRPLPGQRLVDYESAVDAWRLRWRSDHVTVTPCITGGRLARGRLVITVATGSSLDRLSLWRKVA